MMLSIIKNALSKRAISALLCFMMLFFNTAPFVLANETSNISNVNWTQDGNHRVYDIEAEKFSGNTGFRHYDNFKLIQGDIANLLYKSGNREYANFINLVKNQVVLNPYIIENTILAYRKSFCFKI